MIDIMTCGEVAKLVGYVAVDRDAGVSRETRIADTYAALVAQNVKNVAEVLRAVSWVYSTKGTPAQLSGYVATTCTIPGVNMRKLA